MRQLGLASTRVEMEEQNLNLISSTWKKAPPEKRRQSWKQAPTWKSGPSVPRYSIVIKRALAPAASRYTEMLLGSSLLLATLILLYRSNPATSGLFPPCPFLWLTGFYCPGCGSLRALHQLLHGNLRAAFAFNPFALLSFPFLAYAGASRARFLLRGRALARVFIPGWAIWTLAAAVILFGILRNLPTYPFHLLAPGALLAQ
jgi:uncharacterized protein DUF2752